MRSLGGSKSNQTGKRGKSGQRQTCTQVEHHVKVKAEFRMMPSQAKECQRFPANHQTLGERHGADSPSQFSERTNSAHTLISDFWPPNWNKAFLLCSEMPQFVVPHSSSTRKRNVLRKIPTNANIWSKGVNILNGLNICCQVAKFSQFYADFECH